MIVEPAPVWKRLLAWVYDGLILTALWLVSGLVAALLAGGEAPTLARQNNRSGVVRRLFWLVLEGWRQNSWDARLATSRRQSGRAAAHLVRHRPPNGGLAGLPGANRCHAIHRMGAPAPPDNL